MVPLNKPVLDRPDTMPTLKTYAGGKPGARPSVLTLLFPQKVEVKKLANIYDLSDLDQNSVAVEVIEEEVVDIRRFGMWDGVFARCLLNIWGVIMFLRFPFIVGTAGVGWTIVIVILSSIITGITTCSLSAICTNGEVKGGGAYFMIGRALGPKIGGAIGVLFAVANAVSIALYVIGFAEAIQKTVYLSNPDFTIIGDGSWDLQVYGLSTALFVLVLCMNGVDWVVKVQLGMCDK